jgi:hypothetical protein
MREWVCNYDYSEPDGAVLVRKTRYRTDDARGKTFRMWSRGQPDWVWNPGLQSYRRSGRDPARLLYGLPELLEAKAAGVEAIYWPEGEKDRNTLVEKGGVVATTHWQGAGRAKVKLGQAERFRGYRGTVVLAADWDLPGLACVARRYDLLREIGIRSGQIRLVRPAGRERVKLKHGRDVTDHFDAGGTLDTLRPIPLATVRRYAARYTPEMEHQSGYDSPWYRFWARPAPEGDVQLALRDE